MPQGAQQHTTVESAAALKTQDKIEGKYDENMQNINSQYRNEMYKRAENMIPQLDGTFNVSDNSDSDSDDEDIDIDKIVKGDKPKDDRNSATEIESNTKKKRPKD